jgi:hypothetical protein
MSKMNPGLAVSRRLMLRGCCLFLLFVAASASGWAQTRVYELRTYHCYEGKLEALKANFRDFDIRILKRHGIDSVGYWVPQDPALAGKTLVFLLVHPSRAAADQNWAEFGNDPEFIKLAEESKKNGPIVEKVESVYLDPTDFSPMK